MSITLKNRHGEWITCYPECPTSECEDAFALADEETEALDRQPYPRGDWSGDPATYYRPHSHLGGDLPPWHPWNRLPFRERATRWTRGERPDMGPAAFRAARGGASFVGAGGSVTFYDPSLAKLGNAVSPFQVMPSYEAAHLAELRRPEDRYDPRYLAQAPGSGAFGPAFPAPTSAFPMLEPRLVAACDRLTALFASQPEVAGLIAISFAGARRPDGSYVDTRPPGRGLLAEGETQPMPNALEFGVETRRQANQLRALIGDEFMGVPIVYAVREEWMKQIPRRGRPLRDDEMPGWG